MTEPRYTHYFDVRLAISFSSDTLDFDDAFNKWSESFPNSESLRKALLSSDESTKSLIQGIVYSDTHDTLAPATAGEQK
jgi:hypothetical protein